MDVRVADLCKCYGSAVAIKDLNLTISDGALHFILGPSGCGKTTLLRIIAGLETPSAGRIYFGGRDVTSASAADRGVGMVFQNYALWPHMTVAGNIEYGLKIKKLGKAARRKRLDEVLELTQLSEYEDRFPGQLSGGQQQRVALARALAIQPAVLLLDEPLSNLDAKLRVEMRDNILNVHRSTGITTIFVTHDQAESLSMSTGVTVMRRGEEVQTGSARELYDQPKSAFLAGFIGETNFLSGQVTEVRSNGGIVRTPMGDVEVDGKYYDGQLVTLSVRPESISFARSSRSQNNFSWNLRESTFMGDYEVLALQGPHGVLKAKYYRDRDQPPKVNSRIDCHISPADIKVFSDREVH